MKHDAFPRLLFTEAVAPEAPPASGAPATQAGTPPADPSSPPPAAPNPEPSTVGSDWYAALGDDYAAHRATLERFKGDSVMAPRDIVKSYLELRKTGPAYPGEESTPQDVDRFRTLAQVPQDGSLTGYGVELPEGVPDGDRSIYEDIAKIAHDHHTPAPALKAIFAKYQEHQQAVGSQLQQQIETQKQTDQDELVKVWGSDTADNKSTANHFADKFAAQAGIDPGDGAWLALKEFPAFQRIMLTVAKNTGEDGIRPPAGVGDLRSPAQRAQSILDGTDPVHGSAYTDPNASQEAKLAAYREAARLMNESAGKR